MAFPTQSSRESHDGNRMVLIFGVAIDEQQACLDKAGVISQEEESGVWDRLGRSVADA
jgi:hypothetical protein